MLTWGTSNQYSLEAHTLNQDDHGGEKHRLIQIGPRIPNDLRNALRIAAARNNKSESTIVEEALRQHPDVKNEFNTDDK